jgi:cysteinyl-tRNA synthetase
MLNVNGEKMSKSLGNFTTLKDVLDEYDERAFRMLVLKTHYRRQMEVGPKELGDAEKDVQSLDALLLRARRSNLPEAAAADSPEFRKVMDDDFDTPGAIAVMQVLRRDANSALDAGRNDDAAQLIATLRSLAEALGLDLRDVAVEIEADVALLVEERNAARARQDFAESDRIRDELLERGIVLEDTPNGTVWRRV